MGKEKEKKGKDATGLWQLAARYEEFHPLALRCDAPDDACVV